MMRMTTAALIAFSRVAATPAATPLNAPMISPSPNGADAAATATPPPTRAAMTSGRLRTVSTRRATKTSGMANSSDQASGSCAPTRTPASVDSCHVAHRVKAAPVKNHSLHTGSVTSR